MPIDPPGLQEHREKHPMWSSICPCAVARKVGRAEIEKVPAPSVCPLIEDEKQAAGNISISLLNSYLSRFGSCGFLLAMFTMILLGPAVNTASAFYLGKATAVNDTTACETKNMYTYMVIIKG